MRAKFAALVGAILLAAPGVATAADFTQPAAVATGHWYFRADLGLKLYVPPTETILNAEPAFAGGSYPVPGAGELFDESISHGWLIGGGIGYDPAGPHRFDVTLDYERGDFYGRLTCGGCGLGYSQETATLGAWTGLFNFYHDFNSMHHGFAPYVGAGIGASYVVSSNVASDNPPNSLYPGAGHWNFAWALMAGGTKQIGPSLMLDVGYRFLSLGEGVSGEIDDGGGNFAHFEYKNIYAHEFRIGIRKMFH